MLKCCLAANGKQQWTTIWVLRCIRHPIEVSRDDISLGQERALELPFRQIASLSATAITSLTSAATIQVSDTVADAQGVALTWSHTPKNAGEESEEG